MGNADELKNTENIADSNATKENVGQGMNKFRVFSFISVILCMIAALVIYNYAHVNDTDTFFHLAVGRDILQNGFTTIDPFSIHNLQFTSQEWLSDVIFYLVYNSSGYTGLYALQMILTAIILFVIYKTNCLVSNNKKYLSVFLAILFTAFLQYTSIRVRPQIFTILIYALEIYVLESYIRSKNIKTLLAMPFLCIAIANFHIGAFPLFFVLMLPYIFDSFKKIDIWKFRAGYFNKDGEKKFPILLVLMLIMIPLGLLNPYGASKMTYFTSMFNSEITRNIVEWKSPSFDSPLEKFICMTLIIGLLIFAILLFTKKSFSLKSIFLLAGLTIMTFYAIRFYAYFIAFLGLIFIEKIEPTKGYKLYERYNKSQDGLNGKIRAVLESKIAIIVLVIIIAGALVIKTSKDMWKITDLDLFPGRTVEYMKYNLDYKNIRLYNDYDNGGFLLFSGIKVFVDSRADLYSGQFNKGCTVLKDYSEIMNNPQNYEKIFEKYNLQYMLINPSLNQELYDALYKNDDYELVYEEKYYFLFKRLKSK